MATHSLQRCAIASALLALTASAAVAAPRGKHRPHEILRLTGQLGNQCHPGRNLLSYHGGSLVEHPSIFVIFWGSQWQSDATHQAAATDVRTMLQKLPGSGFGCSWREWELPGHPVDAGTYLGDEIVASSPVQHAGDQLSDSAIQSRIMTEVDAGRAPAPTADTIYVVAPPSGVPVSAFGETGCGGTAFTFCAYHDSFLRSSKSTDRFRYVVLPFPCNQGQFTCFFDPAQDAGRSLEALASHEVAETVTDPDAFPVGASGWYDDHTGEENADICAAFGCEGDVQVGSDDFLVNSLWSNLAQGCVETAACSETTPECTDPAPGLCSPGAPAPRGCSLEWLVNPNLTTGRSGLPDTTVTCADGQPFCDVDGTADGQCTFHVAACLNNADPRQTCSASPISGVALSRSLSRLHDPVDIANANALLGALAAVNGPGGDTTSDAGIVFAPALSASNQCTSYFDVVVPINGSRGQRSLKIAVQTAAGSIRERLNLICTPTFP